MAWMDLNDFLKMLNERPDAGAWRFLQLKDRRGLVVKCSIETDDGRNIMGRSWKEVAQQLDELPG